jgi:single-stranded-DNA-specific exonuclease
LVGRLARELGVRPMIAAVLAARGFTDPQAARRFLFPSLDQLHPPGGMLGLDAAAHRLIEAIAAREKILLYGDYDVDGTMSIVILTKAIELLGGQCRYHVPHRLREGYGMRPEVINDAAADGVTLIVSVDTGIRANAVVEHARTLGIDVIVTDHHLPETELPRALAVLNPNQPDCPYPNKNLCGAGVTLKLAQGLLELDESLAPARRQRLLESFLKLAAIATVADVVPLTGENRVIVRCGLAGLDHTPNPGLRALLDVADIKPGSSPTARQVGFQIGPRINAAGRMASARDVVELLLNADHGRAAAIAGELDALNRDRQETEAAMVAAILEQIEAEPVTDAQAALVFSGEGWHKGVVGIVASRVVDRFHRPVFVLSEDAATGTAAGSGRSVPLFHLLDALESMPELFTKFGGHKQAAGLTLPLERLAEFRERFRSYAAERLSPEDFRPQYRIDAVVQLTDLDERTAEDLEILAPFGNENDPPLFALRDVEVAAPPSLIKDQHVFFHARQGTRVHKIKAWRFADRIAELTPGARVDLAVSLEADKFDGWSAILRDVRPAS